MNTHVRAFLLSRQADGCAPSTIEWHTMSLRTFERWLSAEQKPTDPQEWSPTLLREYVVHLQGSALASATVTNKVQSLLAFTRWLHLEGFTDTNVGERIKKPKPLYQQKQPFTADELRRLLKVAKSNPRDHALLCLLIDCGLRANEVCTLLRADVILPQGLLKVTGKGNKQRVVPFSIHSGKVLSKWLARPSESEYVFPTENGCLVPRSLHSLIRRIATKAGVEDAHPHRFRHTFAVSYLRNQGDPLTLQRLLGHTSMTMTQHYVNMNTADLSERHAIASPLTHLLRR